MWQWGNCETFNYQGHKGSLRKTLNENPSWSFSSLVVMALSLD